MYERFFWLRVPVSNNSQELNATNGTQESDPRHYADIILGGEEKARLVKYFDVLIEMERDMHKPYKDNDSLQIISQRQ